jgi:hypothetical protein
MNPDHYANQVITAVRINAQRLAIQFQNSSERFVTAITVAYLSGCNQTASYLTRNDGAATSQQVEKGLKKAGEMLGFELVRPNEAHLINPTPEPPQAETADGKPEGHQPITSEQLEAFAQRHGLQDYRAHELLSMIEDAQSIHQAPTPEAERLKEDLGEAMARKFAKERSKKRWAVQFTAVKGEQVGTIKMGAIGDTWEEACQWVRKFTAGEYDSIGEITEVLPRHQ